MCTSNDQGHIGSFFEVQKPCTSSRCCLISEFILSMNIAYRRAEMAKNRANCLPKCISASLRVSLSQKIFKVYLVGFWGVRGFVGTCRIATIALLFLHKFRGTVAWCLWLFTFDRLFRLRLLRLRLFRGCSLKISWKLLGILFEELLWRCMFGFFWRFPLSLACFDILLITSLSCIPFGLKFVRFLCLKTGNDKCDIKVQMKKVS